MPSSGRRERDAELRSQTQPRRRRYLRRREAAELLGVSANTISRWAREGRLPSIRTLGGHRRFAAEVIEALARRSSEAEGCSRFQDDDETR